MSQKLLNVIIDNDFSHISKNHLPLFCKSIREFDHVMRFYKNNYEIRDVSEVSNNQNINFFHIIFSFLDISEYTRINEKLPLSEETKNLLKENKNLYVVFINFNEAEQLSVFEILDTYIKNDNLDPEQFYLLTGNQCLQTLKDLSKSKINIYPTTLLNSYTIQNILSLDINNEINLNKKYTFCCYNRRIDHQIHRPAIICYLKKYNILEDTNWSFLRGYEFSESYYTRKSHNIRYVDLLIDYVEFDEELNFLSSFNVKEADFEVNLKLDVGKNEFNSNLSYENNSYGQSYINITTETFFTQKNMIFITEKSVFPFFFYQIPIIVATPGHVKKMREKFDLDFFDDLVDHSYDDIIDNRERLLRIVNEIKRLHSMKNQIKTYYQSNIDRLISNKNKMIELSKCYKEIEFFDGLKNLIR